MADRVMMILEGSLEKLERRGGWIQGNYFGRRTRHRSLDTEETYEQVPGADLGAGIDNCYCAVGAMYKTHKELGFVKPGSSLYTISEPLKRAMRAVINAAKIDSIGLEGAITSWNDMQKDKRPVVLAFKKAIEDLKADACNSR